LKKFMLMAALVAVVVAALALPAMAHNKRFNDNNQRENKPWNNWWGFNNWQHHNNNHDNNVPAVIQANEQDVQSGDSTQTFNVRGGGDNSNSCQGIQGISNTGNAVSNNSIIQSGSDGSFVGVSDSGNFTISPSQSTTCTQQVNQAATASGW
jgi:hypothetical protein